MSADDNSVNIEKRYHHGDLRAALIAEGLRLLSEREADALSLREVARNVGVTATSVYRHFPDKQALMTALSREGLAQLAADQHAAANAAGGGLEGFAATGRAYVRFALRNPALFRLIFSAQGQTEDQPEAMTLLQQNAAASEHAALDDPKTRAKVLQSWSLVHGLAMLMLDGQVPMDDALIDVVVTSD